MIPLWFTVAFWAVAIVVSIVLGIWCFEIHGLNRKAFSKAAAGQQIWFNSVGSVLGWIAVWCLARRAWTVGWLSAGSNGQATVSDFALAFVGFVGVSGYLPYATMGAIDALKVLTQKALERAIDLVTPKGS